MKTNRLYFLMLLCTVIGVSTVRAVSTTLLPLTTVDRMSECNVVLTDTLVSLACNDSAPKEK